MTRSRPQPCRTPGCGLVYTPGFFAEHVRDYHPRDPQRDVTRWYGQTADDPWRVPGCVTCDLMGPRPVGS